MFKSRKNGFQITFTNGLTASVMFGEGNDCENRDKNPQFPIECRNTELAVFRGGEQLFCDGSSEWDEDGSTSCPQSITGWLSPDIVAQLLAAIAKMPTDISKMTCIVTLNTISKNY